MTGRPPSVDDLPEPPPDRGAPAAAAPEAPTVAAALVDLALASYALGVTPEGEPFATERHSRTHLAFPLKGEKLALRAKLARDHRRKTSKPATTGQLAAAMEALDGEAHDTRPRSPQLRVAEHDGAIYLDMGDDEGTVARIRPAGWELLATSPVLFSRTALVGQLALPEAGGDVWELFEFINVAPEHRPLVLAWLVSAYLPRVDHAILTFAGEPGTGKSSAARLLQDLVDPSPADLITPPTNREDLLRPLVNGWVTAFDNLSRIPQVVSDVLCQVATGGALVSRQLYTNNDVSVQRLRRVVILTGIDFAGLPDDLASRLLYIELHKIAPDAQLGNVELLDAWGVARPRILGALFTLVGQVLTVREDVPHPRGGDRLADYRHTVAIVDHLLGTRGLETYQAQSAKIARDALSSSPFIELLVGMSRIDFGGSAEQLLTLVTPDAEDWQRPRDWPKDARAVTTALRRASGSLRKQGWMVDGSQSTRDNKVRWRLVSPDQLAANEQLDTYADSLLDEPF